MLIVTDYVTINFDHILTITVDDCDINFYFDYARGERTGHCITLNSPEAALLKYKEIISAYVAGKPIVKL